MVDFPEPESPVKNTANPWRARGGELRRSSFSAERLRTRRAKDELRILYLEREILADAIRRLYEAHAEGKITELERERLAASYKARMLTVKDSMASTS